MDFLYKFREFLSGPPALIVALIIVLTPLTKVMEKLAPAELFETPVSLDEPPPPPPPPKPDQQEIKPQPIEQALPVPDVITKDSVITEIKPAPPEPPRQEAPKVEAPPPVVPRVDVGAVQASYEGIIRRYLESIKRYPTSREARSQRPTGKVGIWLEVARDGTLKEAGVLKTSDSIILDNAALATVRQGKYPPFPNEAYSGDTSRRFNVTLEYNLEQQN